MNRRMPIGYTYVSGKCTINKQEASLVKKMFEMYVSGHSYSQIALEMQTFFPEEHFDKAKIGRVLKDSRYLGTEKYGRIIEDDVFKKASSLRIVKRTGPTSDKKAEILGMRLPVVCPKCGKRMMRKQMLKPDKQNWTCTNKSCDKFIRKNDVSFIEELKDILYELSINPYEFEDDHIQKSINTALLERKIEEQLSKTSFDKDQITKDITDLVGKKYMDITNTGFIQKKIAEALEDYDESQYLETVNEIGIRIEFNEDDAITLVLRDDYGYRRKEHHADRRKNDTIYCTNKANN